MDFNKQININNRNDIESQSNDLKKITNQFNIYNIQKNMFRDIIQMNNSNLVYSNEYNIQVSNKYYIMMLNENILETTEILNYLLNENRNINNPFNDVRNVAGFDLDQIYKINITEENMKEISNNITNTIKCVNESNAELIFVLDINYLINLIKCFDKKNMEIHLYDFILYKLTNKVDKLYILDMENILFINSKPTLMYYELENQLIKKNVNIENKNLNIAFANIFITIYKSYDSIYWKNLQIDQTIKYLDDNTTDTENYNYGEIDDNECLITNTNILELFNSNIFNESKIEVLHPLSKLTISSK